MEGMGVNFDDYEDDVGDDFRVKGRRKRKNVVVWYNQLVIIVGFGN